jgi:hypothetical protein
VTIGARAPHCTCTQTHTSTFEHTLKAIECTRTSGSCDLLIGPSFPITPPFYQCRTHPCVLKDSSAHSYIAKSPEYPPLHPPSIITTTTTGHHKPPLATSLTHTAPHCLLRCFSPFPNYLHTPKFFRYFKTTAICFHRLELSSMLGDCVFFFFFFFFFFPFCRGLDILLNSCSTFKLQAAHHMFDKKS